MKLETASQHNAQLTGEVSLNETPLTMGQPPVETGKAVLEESASRMLRSIQDTLGFSAAEDAILKWLEGCTLDGVERLSFAIEDYLNNRKEAESVDNVVE